jgi:hypothetical protein
VARLCPFIGMSFRAMGKIYREGDSAAETSLTVAAELRFGKN